MVSIYMNGSDKTSQISDWKIAYDEKYTSLNLICYFPSGKSYSQPLSKCKIEPTEQIDGNLLSFVGKATVQAIEKAICYGGRFTVIYYPKSNKPEVLETDKVQIVSETNLKNEAVFSYFKQVINERIKQSSENDKTIVENIQRQLKLITSHPDIALHAYCTKVNQKRTPPSDIIYPFGINESQLAAVEEAFSYQISVIEGPPGTGKTQTILNIVANILLQNKTVVILSNNNSAVENVYEKLAKVDLDYLIAKLGSNSNRKAFFDSPTEKISISKKTKIKLKEITKQVDILEKYLDAQNQIALLRTEISELRVEADYLHKWYNENIPIRLEETKKYPIETNKIPDFLTFLNYLEQRPISLRIRAELLFKFNVVRTKFIDNWQKRETLYYTLQIAYYDQQLKQKKADLNKYEKILEKNKLDELIGDLTNSSMDYLKNHLQQSINHKLTFTAENYKESFDDFVTRYPIIGSSSHSIINSIEKSAQIDYLIIDEASQQDIIPALLGLGCARNVIIVGDRKQLPHIPVKLAVKLAIKPPTEAYDCEKYSLLDSIIRLFEDQVPVTLLKEHYRCHPKIIQFCNKQFYGNKLIPMTKDNGEDALMLITTAQGNHTRNFSNLRELDSLNIVGLSDLDESNTGFIAPYNSQIKLSEKHLSAEIVKATAHKFQGRECDNIIFSTVLDKKQSSQRNIDFVDDSNLINVAVSRAKNKFILVTGNDVFTKNNQSIAALINYIKYYANSEQVHESPVVSAFDLLYNEYDESLDALNSRLNKKSSKYVSEQIISQLLNESLKQNAYRSIVYHREVRLKQLVSIKNNQFDQDQLAFMNNGARCDFVIYFKTGKNPVGVIEVDGHYHNTLDQSARDKIKNTILSQAEIPLLRLKTIESDIEEKIKRFLQTILYREDGKFFA